MTLSVMAFSQGPSALSLPNTCTQAACLMQETDLRDLHGIVLYSEELALMYKCYTLNPCLKPRDSWPVHGHSCFQQTAYFSSIMAGRTVTLAAFLLQGSCLVLYLLLGQKEGQGGQVMGARQGCHLHPHQVQRSNDEHMGSPGCTAWVSHCGRA